jgi:ferredoxin
MIITKQKTIKELLPLLEKGPVFIIGCNECATICQTGGEDQVIEMKNTLKHHNIPVSGWKILEPACHRLNTKRLLKPYKKDLERSKKILVLACGNGIQTVANLYQELDTIPGTDTLFLGEITRQTEYDKRCLMCGECLLEIFGGICPVTRCPKSMLNGPCGGVNHDKCEIDSTLDCVWIQTYKQLKQKKKLDKLQQFQPPKNWSQANENQRCI